MMPGPRYTPHAQVTAHRCTSAPKFVNYRATQLRNPGRTAELQSRKAIAVSPVDLRHCRRSRLAPSHGPGVRAPTRPAFGLEKRCYPPGVSGRRGAAAMTANVQAEQATATRSNLEKSIDLLTVWLISVDLLANAPRKRRKGYNVLSDGGDEARCGRCCMTTV